MKWWHFLLYIAWVVVYFIWMFSDMQTASMTERLTLTGLLLLLIVHADPK